jgi:hypothetical protein
VTTNHLFKKKKIGKNVSIPNDCAEWEEKETGWMLQKQGMIFKAGGTALEGQACEFMTGGRGGVEGNIGDPRNQ